MASRRSDCNAFAGDRWKTEYAARAGIEGTTHQTVTGTRYARYLGTDKARFVWTVRDQTVQSRQNG
jgi:hypothetical protein